MQLKYDLTRQGVLLDLIEEYAADIDFACCFAGDYDELKHDVKKISRAYAGNRE